MAVSLTSSIEETSGSWYRVGSSESGREEVENVVVDGKQARILEGGRIKER